MLKVICNINDFGVLKYVSENYWAPVEEFYFTNSTIGLKLL